MPMYDYLCPSCGPTSALRPVSARAEPLICPVCSGEAPRVIMTAPHISGLGSSQNMAQARNEKARDEPIRSSLQERQEKSRRHPVGCACCSGGWTTRATKTKDGAKVFPSKRPWMICH